MITFRRTRALFLAVVASMLLAACASEPEATTAADPEPPAASAPAGDSGDASAQQAAVQMADTAFSPASVSVAPGGTVTWTNDDSLPHTVSFGDTGPQASDTIDPDGTFEATFDEAGSYPYVCTLHPGMEGTVEVSA